MSMIRVSVVSTGQAGKILASIVISSCPLVSKMLYSPIVPYLLLYQKHLVRQRVAGLIGVELHAAEIIDVHFALCQPDGGKVFGGF